MATFGTIDTSFNYGSGFDVEPYNILFSSDNKIYVCGDFTTYNGSPVANIVRLLPNGDIDNTFNIGSGFYLNSNLSWVSDMKIDNNGKLIVSGDFNQYDGNSIGDNIARLNSDGSLDLSFNTGTGANGFISAIGLQSDGKIIAAGIFSDYNGDTNYSGLVRINTDGSIDNTFGGGNAYESGQIVRLTINNDDSIIGCGYINSYADVNATYTPNYFLVLNSDGTYNTSFASGTNYGVPYFNNITRNAIKQSDGKILICGAFNEYDGYPVNSGFIRLNSDGTYDNTFNISGFTFDVNPGDVYDFIQLANGNYNFIGYFYLYGNINLPFIAHISNNGSVLTQYPISTGFNATPTRFVKDFQNNLYIIGSFTEYIPPVPPPSPFISTWDTTLTDPLSTSTGNNTVQLPLAYGTYNFVVDWGDGTSDIITSRYQAETLHTYTSPGVYTITMTGLIDEVGFGSGFPTVDSAKLISIQKWGDVTFDSFGYSFNSCVNLDLSLVQDVPNLQGLTTLEGTFQHCHSLTSINNIELWNISDVTDISRMFYDCPNFNDNLNNWNVSNVNNMYGTFKEAALFNSPLNTWNTSLVIDMSELFNGANSFNQNINSWNVSAVTYMYATFTSASTFNQPLSLWNVSNVTSMYGMFQNALSFNQNLSLWNTGSVTDMSYMFNNASSFNQDLSSWCVPSIPSLPTSFDDGATSWVLSKPVWGTCP